MSSIKIVPGRVYVVDELGCHLGEIYLDDGNALFDVGSTTLGTEEMELILQAMKELEGVKK